MLQPSTDNHLRWQRLVLWSAFIHSAAWGIFIIALPAFSAKVYGFSRPPTDVHLWQGTGLFILLLGIGYAIAARDPARHWSVVLIGLLAKTLGSIGMCGAVLQDQVSSRVLWLLPVNDLIWLIPFAFIVREGIAKDREANAAR